MLLKYYMLEKEKIKDPTIDRRMKILELVNLKGQVRVNELSQIYDVSEVTIRNDLTQLEKKGLLAKTRGGGLNHF